MVITPDLMRADESADVLQERVPDVHISMSGMHEQPERYGIGVSRDRDCDRGRHHKIQLLREVLTSHPSSFHFSDSKVLRMWFGREKREDFKTPGLDLTTPRSDQIRSDHHKLQFQEQIINNPFDRLLVSFIQQHLQQTVLIPSFWESGRTCRGGLGAPTGASLIRSQSTRCEHLMRRPAGHPSLKRRVDIRLGGDRRSPA